MTVGVSSTRDVSDASWMFGFGDPDVAGTSTGHHASATITGSPVTSGPWSVNPADIGPFGPSGAPAAKATISVSATTLAFDNDVSTPIGNFEFGAVDPNTNFGIVYVPRPASRSPSR